MKHYISIHFEQGNPFHAGSKKSQRVEFWYNTFEEAITGMQQVCHFIANNQGGVIISTQYSLILS